MLKLRFLNKIHSDCTTAFALNTPLKFERIVMDAIRLVLVAYRRAYCTIGIKQRAVMVPNYSAHTDRFSWAWLAIVFLISNALSLTGRATA